MTFLLAFYWPELSHLTTLILRETGKGSHYPKHPHGQLQTKVSIRKKVGKVGIGRKPALSAIMFQTL